MKTLHLLRHAKSSWKDPRLDDHERPLNKRGRDTAKAIAAYLRRTNVTPDVVLCSTAVRAQQTLKLIAKAIKPPKVVLERGIYEVTERKLWRFLRKLPESADCALMIGHNPGLHHLALMLADARSRSRLPSSDAKFPTGAIASFSFEGPWKELRPNGAAVASYLTPKDIASKAAEPRT
jgi:phosphohistidine phosphatase